MSTVPIRIARFTAVLSDLLAPRTAGSADYYTGIPASMLTEPRDEPQ